MKRVAIIFIITLFVYLNACNGTNRLQNTGIIVGEVPQGVEDVFLPRPDGVTVVSWVEGLEIPWQLVFLPDGNKALVTERPGRIRLIENNTLRNEPYMVIRNVGHIGEGGLMGLALHPDFPDVPYLYTMYTYREGEKIYNRVSRLIHRGDYGEYDCVILDRIPGHSVHNGGRIRFGPDRMLYITTGDIWQAHRAQDVNNLGGKILRLTPDGDIPDDNPFPDSPVYSLGHRNPQGLAWHPETGHLFISDHGPSGEFGLRGRDMIKVIQPGGNYGWPETVGYIEKNKYLNPLVMWVHAVPPSGVEFYNGDLFIATLRSQALIRIQTGHQGEYKYEVKKIERWFATDEFRGTYGRLRDVVAGPGGQLYILTNNRDGRGSPRPGDDKILRVSF
ncbi:MAG: PQQ-dependent sugar dehydrogenase [Candidatus Loosdrechtia sp.]|uniref:PQQ-dependent sugar dehydrogenase n=1 Tax=Candidatus Loosdrechtia sp. TaxID=3101272 RepID=UPI003A78C0EC|nr:MAG: PQQ-dependent sugar dehydrogenase [Candidatus Jettenia sp. AMX2]